jgi:hypothetical protein
MGSMNIRLLCRISDANLPQTVISERGGGVTGAREARVLCSDPASGSMVRALEGTAMITPGIHTDFNINHYGPEEQKILQKLKTEWYVTASTHPVSIGRNSVYRAFLMKATDLYSEMFNLEREILSIFSSYSTFDVRALDAFEAATKRWQPLRTDNVCRFLFSKDNKILSRVDELLKSEPELPLIVPFSYDELLKNTDPFFIRNRMRKYFYTRDLFALENPLEKDLYFFGRNQIVQELLNRHKSGENSARIAFKTGSPSNQVDVVPAECHQLPGSEGRPGARSGSAWPPP